MLGPNCIVELHVLIVFLCVVVSEKLRPQIRLLLNENTDMLDSISNIFIVKVLQCNMQHI